MKVSFRLVAKPLCLSMLSLMTLTLVPACNSSEKVKDRLQKEDKSEKKTSDKKSKEKAKKENKSKTDSVEISKSESKPKENEPAFCKTLIDQVDTEQKTKGIVNGATFKLGNNFLNGLAVGHTANKNEQVISKTYAQQIRPESCFVNASFRSGQKTDTALANEELVNKCTFYFNQGSGVAKNKYNWYRPRGKTIGRPDSKGSNIEDYLAFFGANDPQFQYDLAAQEKAFAEAPYTKGKEDKYNPHLLYACVARGQVTMGCDGMKHRGPTFLGMLVAYAGCSAKTTENFIRKQWGYEFGGKGKNDPSQSLRLPYFESAHRLAKSKDHIKQAEEVRKFFEPRFDPTLIASNGGGTCGVPPGSSNYVDRALAQRTYKHSDRPANGENKTSVIPSANENLGSSIRTEPTSEVEALDNTEVGEY